MATTTTTTSAPRRELAAELMAAHSTGITGVVQERVHSTSIGVEATSAFLVQLLEELEHATAEFLVPGVEALDHAQEVELGTLITASSLSVRYVTERDAMLPLLSRFRAAFSTVLRFDAWAPAFLGLKTVAAMASTRVLEAFGSDVSDTAVERDITWLVEVFVPLHEDEHQWLLDLFAPPDAAVVARKADALLRPLCELIAVAVQTHSGVHRMIYATVLPKLLALVQRLGDEYSGDVRAADATLNELATTIGVLLDAKLPPPPASVWSLLPLPSFVEGAAVASEPTAKTATSDGEESDGDDDEPAKSPLRFTNGDSSIFQCVATLCGWLSTPGRRVAAAAVLPLLAHAIALHDPEQYNTDTVATIVDALVVSLRDAELSTLADFAFVGAVVEALRDVLLRVRTLPSRLRVAIVEQLQAVLPRLETALEAIDASSSALAAIKTQCSTTRALLVEAIVAWLDAADGPSLTAATIDAAFVTDTAVRLADPRVFGDVVSAVSRTAAADGDGDADGAVDAVVTQCVAQLTRALSQLDRYSKTAAKHIVAAVTRIAVASRACIAPFADALALPLLERARLGRSTTQQRASLAAVTSILLSSAAADAFELDAHAWSAQLLDLLLERAVTERAPHALAMLVAIATATPLLRARVAAASVGQQPQQLAAFVHDQLARWPLFDEDVDTVLLTLDLLAALLPDDAFKSLIAPAPLAATLRLLAANALGDDMDAVARACDNVLTADCFASATAPVAVALADADANAGAVAQ